MRTTRIAVVAVAAAGLLMAGTHLRRTLTGWIMPVVHASGGCSNSSLRGAFGFQFSGTVPGFGPIAGEGLNNYDGAGHFTGTQNVNINGLPLVNQPVSGTYTVNADCTGTQTINTPDPGVVHLAFVLVGKQGYAVQIDPGVVLTSVTSPAGPGDQD